VSPQGENEALIRCWSCKQDFAADKGSLEQVPCPRCGAPNKIRERISSLEVSKAVAAAREETNSAGDVKHHRIARQRLPIVVITSMIGLAAVIITVAGILKSPGRSASTSRQAATSPSSQTASSDVVLWSAPLFGIEGIEFSDAAVYRNPSGLLRFRGLVTNIANARSDQNLRVTFYQDVTASKTSQLGFADVAVGPLMPSETVSFDVKYSGGTTLDSPILRILATPKASTTKSRPSAWSRAGKELRRWAFRIIIVLVGLGVTWFCGWVGMLCAANRDRRIVGFALGAFGFVFGFSVVAQVGFSLVGLGNSIADLSTERVILGLLAALAAALLPLFNWLRMPSETNRERRIVAVILGMAGFSVGVSSYYLDTVLVPRVGEALWDHIRFGLSCSSAGWLLASFLPPPLPPFRSQSYRAARHGPAQGQPGICRECGYDLTGNVSGVCPECGTRIAV